MSSRPARWGRVLFAALAPFIGTLWLFYFLAFDDTSPAYTDSDGRLLLAAIAWIGVGLLLLAARQHTWGLAWLIGSTTCIGGYVVLALTAAFAMGS